MEKHNGQIAEYLVRKYGYSITDLAYKLGVNRRSIYNYFQKKDLKSDVILKIGKVLRHDFSKEFPELFTHKDFEILPKQASHATYKPCIDLNEDEALKNKYINILEKYTILLVNCVNKTGICCDNSQIEKPESNKQL